MTAPGAVSWWRAALPAALVVCGFWLAPGGGRSASPSGAACTEGGLQRWLAMRLEQLPPEATSKEERAVFDALLATGQKSLDRYLVARALHRGDPGRYGDDPVPAELDEAALLFALHEMPAYRNLQARLRAYPGKARVELQVPGAIKPRVIDEAVSPETSNELLEAIRSAPTVTGPTRRREIDVVAELPSPVFLLGEDVVKSRVLVQLYRERPEVFRSIFARRITDPAFVPSLERSLGISLTLVLRQDVTGLVRDLEQELDRDGFPAPRLQLLATEHPAAFNEILASHLRARAKALDHTEWRYEVADDELRVAAEAGHFAFRWRVSFQGLVLGDGTGPAPVIPQPEAPAEIVRRCVGKLCLVPTPN